MEFEEMLARATIAIDHATVEAVREAAETLLSDSRDVVPYDTGDLSRSGKVTVEQHGDTVESAVSYDTPYAVVQHEDQSLRHDGNGQANYLGGPLRANSQRYLDHIASKVRGALGG